MIRGIRDRVAIVGMGCTPFGERFDCGADDLVVDAATMAMADAGISPDQIDAYWVGTLKSGTSGLTLSRPLQIRDRPVTRVENFCASGTEAFRAACYAVAAGVSDLAMAVGVEKLKDSGYSGLDVSLVPPDGAGVDFSVPASFALLAPAYFQKYGLNAELGKRVLARIAWKNHQNGALNPLAHYRRGVDMDEILASPVMAEPLGIMDCAGVTDGAAAVVVARAEDAGQYRPDPVYVKALAVSAGASSGDADPFYDFTTITSAADAARKAYAEAGITDPRTQLDLAEVHDCFTVTELVLMEDLQFSPRGAAWRDVLDGSFDRNGVLPVNPDGGLKSFGHPIGASGVRMLFECYLQLREKAGPRQIRDARLALCHNLGGVPWSCISAVTVLGRHPEAL